MGRQHPVAVGAIHNHHSAFDTETDRAHSRIASMGIDDRPPTPKYLSNAVRVLEVSILVVMAAWVFGPLHGVRVTPKKVESATTAIALLSDALPDRSI